MLFKSFCCSDGDEIQQMGLAELQKSLENLMRSKKEKARKEQLAILEVNSLPSFLSQA